MELASWVSRGAIWGLLGAQTGFCTSKIVPWTGPGASLVAFWGLLGATWGHLGEMLQLWSVLGVLLGPSWAPETDFGPPKSCPGAAQGRSPRRENHYFTKVSCMSAFQPQSRPKSQESAPERLWTRQGTPFSGKIVILRRFWLGRAWLRHRSRTHFLK